MPNGISNWTKFQVPGAPLGNFTRSEPFPSMPLKATYTDPKITMGDKRRKRKEGVQQYYQALLQDKE
jgi:hypothetical protein